MNNKVKTMRGNNEQNRKKKKMQQKEDKAGNGAKR